MGEGMTTVSEILLQGMRRTLSGLTVAFVLVLPAYAESSGTGLAMHYPAGSISTNDNAEQALAEAALERNAVEQRYALEQEDCYSHFFATACMEDAKERRRKALAEVRAVEVEANEFKRKARVVERDRALAERLADSDAKRAENEKRMQNAGSTSSQKQEVNVLSTAAAQASSHSSMYASPRVVRQAVKMQRIQAEESANAAKRTENVAAYEKKQREAQERQKAVENRKAEKERERLRKQAPSLPSQ